MLLIRAMKKQQLFFIVVALLLTTGLYFGGDTTPKKKEGEEQAKMAFEKKNPQQEFSIDQYISETIKKLPINRQQFIISLEKETKRGNIKEQQIKVFKQEAAYWRDTLNDPIAYFHFIEKAATLENSEKSLTFAAHSILRYLPFAEQTVERVWLANCGRALFEKALNINPSNDSSTIGLGGCYIFGAANGEEGNSPMTGISKIREVVAKDSNNIFAQYMLGVGGIVSGQFDKAAQRFEKVVKAEPNNLEVLFKLAETYENLGDKQNAIKWYTVIHNKSKIPDMQKELEQRINQLKQ